MIPTYDPLYTDPNVIEAIRLLENSGWQLEVKRWWYGSRVERIIWSLSKKLLIFRREKPEPNAIVNWKALDSFLANSSERSIATHISMLIKRP